MFVYNLSAIHYLSLVAEIRNITLVTNFNLIYQPLKKGVTFNILR